MQLVRSAMTLDRPIRSLLVHQISRTFATGWERSPLQKRFRNKTTTIITPKDTTVITRYSLLPRRKIWERVLWKSRQCSRMMLVPIVRYRPAHIYDQQQSCDCSTGNQVTRDATRHSENIRLCCKPCHITMMTRSMKMMKFYSFVQSKWSHDFSIPSKVANLFFSRYSISTFSKIITVKLLI